MTTRDLLRSALLLGALGALPAPPAHAGELLLLESQTTSGVQDAKTVLRRVDPSPQVLLDSAATGMRMSAALPVPDGTDLMLAGRNSGGQVHLLRLGRQATASSPTGCTTGECYGALFGPVLLSPNSSHLPAAAWLKGDVAVVMGETTTAMPEGNLIKTVTSRSVFIYPAYDRRYTEVQVLHPNDPLTLITHTVLAPRGVLDVGGVEGLSGPPRLLASTADGSHLYVSDGTLVLRLDISVNSDGVYSATSQRFTPIGSANVRALATTADGGALLGVTYNGGSQAGVLRLSLAGTFTAVVDAIDGGMAAAVESDGSVLASLALESGGALRLLPADVSVNNAGLGGAIAAFPGRLLAAGRDPLDISDASGKDGYRVYSWDAGSLTSISASDTGRIRALAAQPDPAFGLSQRTVHLDGASATARFGQLRVYGGMGKTLRIQGGTCSDMITQIHLGTWDGPLLQDQALPSDDQMLVFTQPRLTGEACWLALSAAGNGAGALLKVEGTPSLGPMALVLDGSGSMGWPVKGNDGPSRLQALKEVLTRFLSAIGTLADAQITVVPFNQGVLASPHGTGFTSGAMYGMGGEVQREVNALRAEGATNIRGALEEAAKRLESTPGNTRRTVVLMTDGEHNTYQGRYEDVSRLADVKSELLKEVFRRRRIDRLYAVGLTEAGAHPTLRTLVKEVNQATTGIAVQGDSHPGYMSYADNAEQLDLFFTKVFWGYLNATQYVDPIVTLAPNEERTWPIRLLPTDEELFVHVSNVNRGQTIEASLSALPRGGGAPVTVRCQSGLYHLVCALRPRDYGTTEFLLRVKNDVRMAPDPGPRTLLVEVGGRSAVRMRGAPGQAIYRTGDTVRLRMALTSAGLPIPGARGVPLRVTGQLTIPTAGLGTALANARVGADAISKAMGAIPGDQRSALSAKYTLLTADQLPGQRTLEVELFDDGQHGDGQAGDGVFGIEAAAQAPGAYRLVARAEYQAGDVGWVREGAVQVEVQPALDAKASIVSRELTFPESGSEGQRGSLVLGLRPQDAQGNLLGPGQGPDMVVRQGGRTLPAKIAEPAELDGSYRVEVTGIRPEVPVVLELLSSGAAAYVANEPPEVGPGTGCDGCRLGGAGRPAGGAAALALGLLALALLRRRRR